MMDLTVILFGLSIVATVVVLVLAGSAAIYHLREARAYGAYVQQIPDAARLPGLKSEVANTAQALDRLQKELVDTRDAMRRRSEAEAWYASHGAEYEQATQQLPQLTSKLVGLQAEINALESERVELTKKQPQFDTLRVLIAKKEDAEGWLTKNESIYVEAQRQLPILEKHIETTRADLAELCQQRDDLMSEVTEGKHEREWLQQEDHRQSDLIEQQKKEVESSRKRVDELQAREAGLAASLAEVQVRVEQKQMEFDQVISELASVRKQIQEAYADLNGVIAEHERRKREIDEFKIEHQNLIKLLEAAEKRWTQLAPAAGGSEDQRLVELWEPALSPKAFAGPRQLNEHECLTATENYLCSLGLRFSRRVLRAFHTSLKVCDISPLVVLAGISGTGKSELPRRYAEGMGIHFLNIPVQPRWDSPQDMFGFYNYMENRYRATELARALVQMDPFFSEAGRGWCCPSGWEQNSVHKQMLLVLLDEMNLARVEYYFSEFLSRLETRRGVDRGDSIQRRKAEIALEVGLRTTSRPTAGNGDQASMQIFVDRNVLFVGTMNEDETTQTLSEKVVDRANVLRFGKPRQFVSRRQDGNGSHPIRECLLAEHWTTWIRHEAELDPAVEQQVSDWIGKLAEAMQLIRRPFAHRTYGAMRAYVVNYPDPASYRDALADQIEQKILPKFRGLDPQEGTARQGLQKVCGVLEDLGDHALKEALNQSMQHGEHQFTWQGLDRVASE